MLIFPGEKELEKGGTILWSILVSIYLKFRLSLELQDDSHGVQSLKSVQFVVDIK
jgi:hypothetical protein